ncbi:MAG: hypothetical protein IPK81_17045 [Rhodospirillales bacterium]|nr:MAG: hypothetical protein IPK81_17045 [Rhodospirillales bacterium]
MGTKLGFLTLAAGAALAISAAAPAQAQSTAPTHPYGCACLNNNIGVPINFRYRWGEGEWKTTNLPTGMRSWMCYTYPPGTSVSPQLVFQLDVDMTSGQAWTTYTITRMQSPQQNCNSIPAGAQYDVRYRPGSNNALIHVTKRQ